MTTTKQAFRIGDRVSFRWMYPGDEVPTDLEGTITGYDGSGFTLDLPFPVHFRSVPQSDGTMWHDVRNGFWFRHGEIKMTLVSRPSEIEVNYCPVTQGYFGKAVR